MLPAVPEKHVAKRVLRVSTTTDWPAVRWIGPLRTTIVATTAVSIGIAVYGPKGAFPFAVGTLFVGFADQRGDFNERVRGLLIAALLVTFATFIGVSVSGNFLAHLVTAGVFAAFCGYIGVSGPRAALAGVVAMVTFAAFSGTPEPFSYALPTTLKVLIAATAMTTVITVPMLAGRLGGLRTDVAVSMRAQGFALRGMIGGVDGTNAAGKLAAARARVAASGCYDKTLEWFEGMLSDLETIRFGFLALNGALDERDLRQQERVDQFKQTASELLMVLASVIEIPASRRRINPRLDAFDDAASSCVNGFKPRTTAALGEIEIAIRRLSQSVAGQWPVGLKGQFSRGLRVPVEEIGAFVHRRDPDSLFKRHAIRVSGLMVVATAISQLDPLTHSYWIPLTVAWITKPDFAGTTTRVVERVLGTLIGVIASIVLINLIGTSIPFEVVMFSVGAMITLLFLVANYTLCTVGVTLWLMAVLDISSAPTEGRVLQTLAAGLLVIGASRIWPTRTSSQAGAGLANMVRALRSYCDSIIGRDNAQRSQAREALIGASLKASTIIEESGHEPGKHLIHYDYASSIDRDLRAATAIAASFDEVADLEPSGQLASPEDLITERSLADLDDLAARLSAIQQSGVVTRGDGQRPGAKTAFERLITEADHQLDELAIFRQAHSVAAGR